MSDKDLPPTSILHRRFLPPSPEVRQNFSRQTGLSLPSVNAAAVPLVSALMTSPLSGLSS